MADIVCNYKKCRESLKNEAWITICSHIFCEEHGKQEFTNSSKNMIFCPACNTQLNDRLDVVQTDLNPSEAFKSIVLAGLKPDIIMDIAMRAISFWDYQMKQEIKYQKNVNHYLRERVNSMEDSHSSIVEKLKSDMVSIKKNHEIMKEEVENQTRENEKLSVLLEEKDRKIQKMQYQLNDLKRNSCQINKIEDKEPERNQNLRNIMNRYQQLPDYQFKPNIVKDVELSRNFNLLDNQDMFVFNPVINLRK